MSRHALIVLLALASATATAQDANSDAAAKSAADTRGAQSDAAAKSAADARSAQSAAAAKRQAKATSKVANDAASKTDTAAEAKDEVKTLSGISILGNQEAPKSLVIVPWKSSEIGDMPGLSRLLDDSVQPIDKEVFMRELDYYEIRSSSR